MCLWAIFGEMSISGFWTFLIGILLLRCMGCLYILEIVLVGHLTAHAFRLPVAFSFGLWFPLLCKILCLIRSIRFIFAFIFIALRDWPKTALVRQLPENALPLSCSRSFMVSCLIFKPWATLSFFLLMAWGCVLSLLIYMLPSSFPRGLLYVCQRFIAQEQP